MTDQDYIKAYELWHKSLTFDLQQMDSEIEFHQKQIELDTQKLDLMKEQRVLSIHRLEVAKDTHLNYLEANKE